jgi:hypothetical protein
MNAELERSRLERAAIRQAGAAERGALYVPWQRQPLPAMEPWSERWEDTPELEIPMLPQNVAMPALATATIETVTLQGLSDGERIVWRVRWSDSSTDTAVDVGRFTDAVALQFPLGVQAKFTMGDHREPVEILHWKAVWQKDVDDGFQDVQDLHPNYWTDLYWFATGERPFRIPDAFSDPRSLAWFAAYSAGNPIADFGRVSPVEELWAEGFGTLTTQPESVTVGRGEWRDGAWAVTFARPLRTRDPLDEQFWSGGRGNVMVAVWDGGSGNVGGRKHWSNWTEYEVTP